MQDKHSPTTLPKHQMSSTSLALQQFNKETEKKEAAAEAAKTRCRTCFKEIAPVPRCFGHGGGGSSSDSPSEEKVSQGEEKLLSKLEKSVEDMDDLISEFDATEYGEELNADSDEKDFAPEIIADLIAKELLVVNNDRKSMTFTIQLQCAPSSLTKEQRHELKKYMTAILNEFNEFKKENKLSDDCLKVSQDAQGNITSLHVTMPTLAIYDAFIQRLANNLVPTPNPKAQVNDDVKNEQRFSPNPYLMEPKPTKQNEVEKDDIVENETKESMRLSPFKIKPW